MSERSRRRSSKWDLKEGVPLSPENIRERGRELDKLATWDGDGGYSTRMSPGLDWRRHNNGHSPKGKGDRPMRKRSRSRSRSRSPIRGFRQELGNHDRNNRSRSAAPCRDFGAGRCRRGSDCPFVHQGNRNYDDSWDDRHRRGGTSKYSTAHDAPEYPLRSGNERERERNRSTDTICKFFAAGNCRSGKYCRFSHGKTSESPERKMDEANKYWEDPRWKETGPLPDAGKFEEGNGRRGSLNHRVNDRSSDGRRDSRFEKESRRWNDHPTAGASSVISPEPRSAEKVLGDADMSPDWNYSLKPKPLNPCSDERRHSTYTSPVPSSLLPVPAQETTWPSSGQMNHSASVNKEIRFDNPGIPQSNMNFSSNGLHGQGYDQNRQNMSAVGLPNLNPVGQANVAIPVDLQRGVTLHQPNSGMSSAEDPNTSQITGVPPNHNTVSGAQLTQLTNISASIAQLLEAGKQLPQLYAALSTPQPPPPEGPVNQVTHVLSNAPIMPPEQSDRLCASTEQKRVDNVDGLRQAADGVDGSNTGRSDQVGTFGSLDEDSVEEDEEGRKKVDESKEVRNSDQTEKENHGGVKKDEDGKKNKEAKHLRAFKFALAEFAKELLKPSWKDGLVGKDAFKTIVKKVVNKVTGSLQGANIPQSQEKIEQYLSASKPKLTKLVQAYVEKFQKPNK